MTETAAQQHFRLPVDDSPPKERLRWPMLLAAATGVLLIHAALVTVFTPLAPEQNEPANRTDHSAIFVSSLITAVYPDFLNKVDTYDPIAFLHPPAEVGFSFFRVTQDDFSLESPSEPVLPPRKFAELEPLPPFEPEPVVRPLALSIPRMEPDSEAELMAAGTVSYPYCVADSRPDVNLPAFPLDTQSERILRRTPPARPSVFELRNSSGVIPSPADPGGFPRCEAILTGSCGITELDLAARAWLDTLLNSQEETELRPGDKCRVVWSAKAFGKEPSR
jgi:hypothetical protein